MSEGLHLSSDEPHQFGEARSDVQDMHDVGEVAHDMFSDSPEKPIDGFQATTFADAKKLPNPVPDDLLKKVVDGFLDNNPFWNAFNVQMPKDSSDLAITQDDVEREYEKAKELRKNSGKGYSHSDLVFEHYSTRAYGENQSVVVNRELTKRIYLNPKQIERLDIFSELLDELNARGLAVKTKVAATPDATVARPDGVLVYSDDEQADQVLEVVLSIWLKHKESFVNRITPFATLRLADGVGVAAEDPRYTGEESATTIREKIVTTAMTKLADQLEKTGKDITKIDRSKLVSILKGRLEKAYFTQPSVNIDPNNWSFNL